MFQILFDKISGMLSNIMILLDGLLDDTPVLLSIGIGLLLAVLMLSIFYFIHEQFFKITRLSTKGITLIDGVRDATRPYRIASNPNDINYIEIPRSYNEKDGTEFTYNLWFVVNEPGKEKEWRHIFHKGSPNGYPLRAPGVWIRGNTLKVAMNTVDKIDNSINIDDIPIKKWCMLTLVLRGNQLEIFLNGYLKKILDFDNQIPRLNDEPIYFTQWGGFKGYIAKVRYLNYAIDGTEIKNLFEDGPATDGCSIGFDVPPYLATGENITSKCSKE